MTTFTGSGAVITDTPTNVFTSTVDGTVVKTIHCANIIGVDTSATVTWTDSSAASTYTLIFEALVPVNSALQVLDGPIVLDNGDSIEVTSGDANSINATVAALTP